MMKKILLAGYSILALASAHAQPVIVELFQKVGSASTAQIGVRVRASGADVQYSGVSFYVLYQSASAAPQSTTLNSVTGVDDSKMVTGFSWGFANRNTNPAFVVSPTTTPATQTYDRMYIYGNSDETSGSFTQTLTSSRWDTLLFITFNNLQPTYPQGGYAYIRSTAQFSNAALTDPFFTNIPYSVASGDIPLGIITTPVTFTKSSVTCSPSGASIAWSTASESNTSYFEVLKSVDAGNNWVAIDRKAAAGSSATDRNYQSLDLEAGAALYKIRQVDRDGRSTESAVMRSSCEAKNAITSLLYPVPAKNNMTLAITSNKMVKTSLRIVDAQGRLMQSMEVTVTKGNNNIPFNVSRLAAGEYMLISSNPELTLNKKFVVAR